MPHGAGLIAVNSLDSMENEMVDFSKFDVSKMFDTNTVIDTVEKNNRTFAGLITNDRARVVAESINAAGCALVRSQVAAMKDFQSAVKKALAA